MIKETITQIILKPSANMYLTDGETYASTMVILPAGADEEVWYEITEEEYEELISS